MYIVYKEDDLYRSLRYQNTVCYKEGEIQLVFSYESSTGTFYGNEKKVKKNRKVMMILKGENFEFSIESFKGKFLKGWLDKAKGILDLL